MTGDDELLQVEQVIERLISRYPSIPPSEVEVRVRTIHKRFADSRIRAFLPLLVEKAARQEIGADIADSAIVSTAAPTGPVRRRAGTGRRRVRRWSVRR
ncbi:three-helix bundle dimerization domain-containing protein [Nocardia sp. NBC_00416]|uniref:three-helix bundle dimerization domain-containing protein n=1 Tax=Nocardia sp. NBC_00416 TaxID=2975991 RepID=UPI002E1B8F90